ncbi:hypothetical protein P4129_20290 [Pseudomonas aeruginosa]|nr:hypothetical protein [Pseudomonas aeruginosa]
MAWLVAPGGRSMPRQVSAASNWRTGSEALENCAGRFCRQRLALS